MTWAFRMWLLMGASLGQRRLDPAAPWHCAVKHDKGWAQAKMRESGCVPWVEDPPEDATGLAVELHHMEIEPAEPRGCCGLPEPECDASTPPPMSCLLETIPFGTPPACAKRQFHCCLSHWMGAEGFGVVQAYEGNAYATCKGRIWDVENVGALDVLFDHRSLHKLAARATTRGLPLFPSQLWSRLSQITRVYHEKRIHSLQERP